MSKANLSKDFFIRLNAGAESAADEVVRRYREQLCAMVEKEMGKRFAGREDPEDPVQSALQSFCRGIHEQRFHIDHGGSLWRLLEEIARHKMLKHIEHHDAAKRRPALEVPTADRPLQSPEPLPEEAAHVADVIQQVLAGLAPPDPEVFRLRLEGRTRAEIAQHVHCTESAVRVKLDRIAARLRRILKIAPHH